MFLLQSELLPSRIEDEVFKKFILQINNHQTLESHKLMSFLYKRPNPRNIDLTYEWQEQIAKGLDQQNTMLPA